MTRNLDDVLRIMRLAIGRRNLNDPDSNDDTLIQYVQDFLTLKMSDDLKIFENFAPFEFTIDETATDGIYSLEDSNFVNFTSVAFISLTDPVNGSISWNRLCWYQDPGEFYGYWGINNDDILIAGYPTDILYYNNELVLRTIPDDDYTIRIFGYKQNDELSTDGNPPIPYDHWLRYLAYGAALDYARDYRFENEDLSNLERNFRSERKLLLTRTHNQVKTQRCYPKF